MDEKSQEQPQQSFLERLKSRSLSDIRIHTGGRAGDLTRRLGARAFTVGRDIYVKPELLESMSAEGEAVIAHELTHVAEQTGRDPSDLPLLRPQRQPQAASQGSSGSVTVQRALGAGVSGSEARAGQAEQSARSSSSSSGAQGSRQDSTDSAPPPDAEELAERVYVLMVQELTLDSERGVQHR